MGQVLRMLKYDQGGNISNAIVSPLVINDAQLVFHRLDDGVMGGNSVTDLKALNDHAPLVFAGTINTDGGGFASIRSPLEKSLPAESTGIKLKYRGDGKTYKVLLSKGGGSGGPFSRDPSWQADLPTVEGETTEMVIPFESFRPSFGGGGSSRHDMNSYVFHQEEIRQIGLMLSLKLSCGTNNPIETFGEGVFDFKLEMYEIDLLP